MAGKTGCEACGTTDVHHPATPSCRTVDRRPPWVVVEKRGACERLEDDLEAALFCFRAVGCLRCENGGGRVLAYSRRGCGGRSRQVGEEMRS